MIFNEETENLISVATADLLIIKNCNAISYFSNKVLITVRAPRDM